MRLTKTILLLTMIILTSSLVVALPVPQGIDGVVYNLDGLTQVREGIPVIIKNLETNETINIETGKGFSGRYSTTIPWVKGTQIKVMAKNPLNNVSRTITLEGVIRNLDLHLNMSLPSLPPEIRSQPLLEAELNELYEYEIEFFDWNSEKVNIKLNKSPEGMELIDNKIMWIPSWESTGHNEVIIFVNNSEHKTIQEFSIFVNETDDVPFFKSKPVKEFIAPGFYEYEIMLYRDAEIELVENPSQMLLEDKILKWDVRPSSRGNHFISLKAVNEELEEYQNFTLEIKGPEENRNERRLISTQSVVENEEENTPTINTRNNPVKKVSLEQDINIEIIQNLERNKLFNRLSYSYISITANTPVNESVNIEFLVDKKWIYKHNLSKEDITLAKYVDGWQDLETRFLEEEEDFYVFESESPGLSLFAITIKETAMPVLSFESRSIQESYVIMGEIKGSFLNRIFKPEIVLQNEEGNLIKAELRTIQNSLRYQAVVNEKGHYEVKTRSLLGEISTNVFIEENLNVHNILLKNNTLFIVITLLFIPVLISIYRRVKS